MREPTTQGATAEETQLLRLGDGGPLAPGGLRLFQHRFEEVAGTEPWRPALSWGPETLTYGELDRRANRVAHRLRPLGVRPEVVVGICLPRGIEAIVTLLGVLKAGGAYLWLEPAHPFERRHFMLADAGAAVLVTIPSLASGYDDLSLEVITPDHAAADGEAVAPPSWCPPEPSDLAYIMYTSGSTGTPKGVMIEHHCLSSFVEWGGATFSEEELSGVLLATSLGFDASIFELFVPLGCGGRIVVIENLFAIDHAPAGQVRTINSVPSLMTALLDERDLPESVRTVVLVGELMAPELADRLHAQPRLERLVNAYGPTEDTCFSTWEDVPRDRPPTIGRPLPGTQAYILNPESTALVAEGEAGELCLGGYGLARGYRNREELTREKFIDNPFPGTPSERLYRTGDLARWEPDGSLQHLGRIDHQIKVRGVRIEPGEIESSLMRRDDVRHAVVIARPRPDGQKQLVAYIVCANGKVPETRDLRDWLRRSLPEPMVPSAFVALDELPLNANGKLDRDQLPEPLAPAPEAGVLSATERKLAELWAEALGLEWPPGPDDDFFDLGGQSIIAFKLFALMRDRMVSDLAPSVLVEASTLRALAARIDSGAVGGPRFARVHPEGRRVPWIYIHPGSGGMLTLHNFGRAVGAEQPIFGLQAFPDRDEVGDAMPSVPDASERCLENVRALQPEGPYILTGHSIGGHVAYHIACRLQEEGEEVLFLGLLDPAAPQTLRRMGRFVARGKELTGLGPEGRRPGLLQVGLSLAKHEARTRIRRAAPGVEEAVDEADNRNWESSLIGEERSYRPLRFHGPVTVFNTAKTARFAGATDLGWSRHVDGDVEVVRVPGEHISMLLDPHIHILAAQISKRIDALYPTRT